MATAPRLLITAVLLMTGCRGSTSDAAPTSPTARSDPKSDPKSASKPEADPDAANSTVAPATATVGTPPGPPDGPGSDELPRLVGQDKAALRLEFGEPSFVREFTMSQCCHEFEIELYNRYPPNAGHDAAVIHEWTWQFDGYKLTVWLHQHEGEWVTLETSRYSDDTEF